ncbi:MAG: carbohydrate ABC transporter permease [Devosia sp.]|jgi:ABC-type glycerol-3-phosphate transport system permease component|nr:carbohydrate ABC transporter permease [Devosiaceae bacterium]
MIVGHPWRRRAHVTAVIVVGLLMAAPFYWLIINSLKTAQEVVGYPPTWFPHDIRWQNIADALDLLSVQSVINSLIFTVSVTICQLILVIMTGFAIAKMPFPGRTPLLWLYIITLFVPFQVVLIPTFIIVRDLNWIDSYWGLIVPVVAQTSFGVFVFRQFYVSLPDELLDAARLDGANWGDMFVRIVLPLSGPPIAAYTAVTVLTAWNMYVWPLIATTRNDMRVLPLSIAALATPSSQVPGNVAMMAVLISTLPIIVIFVFCQRYFINGLGGALKE